MFIRLQTCRALADSLPHCPAPPLPAVLTTLQVATVAVAITVGTSLLVGADVDSGSMEGLQAFAAALAAQVAAGAVAAQVRPRRMPCWVAQLVSNVGARVSA